MGRHFLSGAAGAIIAGAFIVTLGFGSSQSGGNSGGVTPPTGVRKVDEAIRKAEKKIVPGTAPTDEKAIPMPPEMAGQIEFMMPGPEHAWLAKKVGKWTFTGRMWSSPDAVMEMTGTSTYEMALGGRFLVEKMNTRMMDMPFEGIGMTGFNGSSRQFQLTWADNMGTQIVLGTGTRAAGAPTLTATYEMFDPMKNGMVKTRSVETRTDDDHFTFSMFGPGPDGKEMKMFEFIYTRTTG